MADLVLANLRVETFASHVGSQFELVLGEVNLPFELVEAKSSGVVPPGYARAPFALTFQGSSPRPLPQAIYRLEHPALGALEIFLVPISRHGSGFRYEAIFT